MSDRLGHEFLVDRSQFVDRMLEPLGGIALVEIESDPLELLQRLAMAFQVAIPETKSEKSISWYNRVTSYGQWQPSGEDGQDFFISFPELAEPMQELGEEVYDLCDEVIQAATPHSKASYLYVYIQAQRRTESKAGHIDPLPLNVWMGATKPGLVVAHNDELIAVDSLPPKHVLVWRGEGFRDDRLSDNAEQSTYPPPIRHAAKYRSRDRRLLMLAWC